MVHIIVMEIGDLSVRDGLPVLDFRRYSVRAGRSAILGVLGAGNGFVFYPVAV
jgi:hypothetical protein